ncbi:MAG: sulfate reduction electron transfer complex DsrMKJOP subunit DsrM [Caldimicrobium thiodismutans]
MNLIFSIFVVILLIMIPLVGVGLLGLKSLFSIYIPYFAFIVFFFGLIYRIINWAKSPQPFKIPTTCGQQKSLPWIKHSRLESPVSTWEVYLRMFFEVFLFRSLFRNLRADFDGKRLIYGSAKWLWLGAILFHISFLVILLRHLRFFVYPVPEWIKILDFVDSFFQIGLPPIYLTDLLILAGLTFLLLRRLVDPKVNYLSYASDYFPLLLIIGIVTTGVLMRLFFKPDIYTIKELAYGLATFQPTLPERNISLLFYIHLFLVCTLAAYFPFSKLVHMVGVFFSPTRNMANDNRMKRHVNPWDYPVKYTTYCEWQERFRDVMEEAGLPIDEEWCKEVQKQV